MGISAETLEAAALAWRTGYHPNPVASTPTQVIPKRKMRKVGKQPGRKGEYYRENANDRIQTPPNPGRDLRNEEETCKMPGRV